MKQKGGLGLGWKYCPCTSVLASLVAAITNPALSSMQDTGSESHRTQPYVGKLNSDLVLIRLLLTPPHSV